MTTQPPEPTIVERMIRAARAAVRCRQAALEDPEAADALGRAALRYSRGVAELADQLLVPPR